MPPPRESKVALAFFLMFAILSVFMATGVTMNWDVHTLVAFASVRTPGVTRVMQALSTIGNWRCEVPLALAITAVLWRRRGVAAGGRFLLIGLSGEAVYAIAKLVFHRHRPEIVSHLSDAGWYSYPSGHAMLAWIVWGFGAASLADLSDSRGLRTALLALALLLPAAISISRVYLGVHYPTDVLGGVLLGIGWVLFWRIPPERSSSAATSSAPATR